MDMEEDAEILATCLKHIPSCISAGDIEQLMQDIPVQPPVEIPVRTVQEAVAAGDLPPLDVDAANVFSHSEHILQEAGASDTPQARPGVVGRGAECHLGEQPGSQPRWQRAAADVWLHSVGV